MGAFQSNDPELIRREAEHVVATAESVIAERGERETRQLSVLAEQERALKVELEQSREQRDLDELTRLHNGRRDEASVEAQLAEALAPGDPAIHQLNEALLASAGI